MKDKILNWFKENYNEFYKQMEIITHDHSNGNKNPFHMEGTILVHTKMVLDWLEINENDNNSINLIFAAILHDLGKVFTKKEDESRAHFKKHENISTYLSIDILKIAKKDFPDIDIIKILKLIAWHGSLWVRKEHDNLEENLKILDYKYGHDLDFYKDLLKFVEADACGRIFKHKEDEDYILEQFKFLNNFIPYDKTKYVKEKTSEVVLLVGLSGSGKSTYLSNNNFNNIHSSNGVGLHTDIHSTNRIGLHDNYEIISVDNILSKGKLNYNSIDYKKNVKKAFDQTMKDMLEAIKKDKNVIIDMTNLDKENRRRKLSKFPSSKYHKKAIVFLNGINEIKSNLLKREDKKIPESVIFEQMLNFELPNYDEFDEIQFIGI